MVCGPAIMLCLRERADLGLLPRKCFIWRCAVDRFPPARIFRVADVAPACGHLLDRLQVGAIEEAAFLLPRLGAERAHRLGHAGVNEILAVLLTVGGEGLQALHFVGEPADTIEAGSIGWYARALADLLQLAFVQRAGH